MAQSNQKFTNKEFIFSRSGRLSVSAENIVNFMSTLNIEEFVVKIFDNVEALTQSDMVQCDDDGVVLSTAALNVQSVLAIAHSISGKINTVSVYDDGTYKNIELCVENTSNPRWYRQTPFKAVRVNFDLNGVGTEYVIQWNSMMERASFLVDSEQYDEVDESIEKFQSSAQDCRAKSVYMAQTAMQSPAARFIMQKAFKLTQEEVALSPLTTAYGRPRYRRNMTASERKYTSKNGRGRGLSDRA
ncbi:hypothetical protein MIR68_010450 [Amoeboaphelidium protococcarum]|nr:hypothetical protein MIR68_010450 [Amoeboaphelidium protococcarum]